MNDFEYCPLIKKKCIRHKCAWYTQVRGRDPNTDKEVDQWGCAVAWLPMLLIENASQSRSTGAAVESFRNTMVSQNQKALEEMQKAANQPTPEPREITQDE